MEQETKSRRRRYGVASEIRVDANDAMIGIGRGMKNGFDVDPNGSPNEESESPPVRIEQQGFGF